MMRVRRGPLAMPSPRRVRLHREHAEHSAALRVITLAMAWCAGTGLGLATGDMAIALILSMVITAGHAVSWRTRTWRSARWQLVLLLPITGVAFLLVPSLPLAFHGDWLHPMRYLLMLQSLASFYLHSRGSLYTAQLLSCIVLLVSSQLAFGSLFLLFFFGFFLLLLVFLAVSTAVDAGSGALQTVARGPRRPLLPLAGWAAAGLAAVMGFGLLAFLVLPWGTLQVNGARSSVLPLSGDPEAGGGTGGTSPSEPATRAPSAGGGGPSGGVFIPGAEAGGEQGTERSAGGTPGVTAGDGVTPEAYRPLADGGTPPAVDRRALDTTVMQVRSPVTSYWKGTTYTRFQDGRWRPDRGDAAFERALTAFDERRRYTQTVHLRTAQERPLAGYSPIAWFASSELAPDLPLSSGDVYQVVSERRDFHPGTLVRQGGDIVVDRPVAATGEVPQAVRELARQITAGYGGKTERMLAITRHLRGNYTALDSATPFTPSQPVEQFLFGRHRAGNAMDFASAQTLLARAAGMDARLVTGYLPGSFDPLSGSYVVRRWDAHAWTEVAYGGRAGWVPFDGSPRPDGRAVTAASGGAAGAVAQLFELRLGDELRAAAARTVTQTLRGARELIVALGAALGLVTMVYLARSLWRRRKPAGPRYPLLAGQARREVRVAYGRLVRALRSPAPAGAGVAPGAFFERLAHRHPAMKTEIGALRALVEVAAYAPEPPSLAEVRAMHPVWAAVITRAFNRSPG